MLLVLLLLLMVAVGADAARAPANPPQPPSTRALAPEACPGIKQRNWAAACDALLGAVAATIPAIAQGEVSPGG